MPNLICPLQLIGLHTEHPVAYSNVGLDQVQGPGTLFQLFPQGGDVIFLGAAPDGLGEGSVDFQRCINTPAARKTGSCKRSTTGRSPFIS